MGISSRDPIMSCVDLTYSPIYSSASTSGTSGCKNWDFGYERYTEFALRQFLKKSHDQFLDEVQDTLLLFLHFLDGHDI